MFQRLRKFVSALAAGDEGERIARRFLGAKPGWQLVACNWRNPRDRREELEFKRRRAAAERREFESLFYAFRGGRSFFRETEADEDEDFSALV